jgi:hypothetical protein
VIYCVVPPELEAELFDKLVEYYRHKPDVTVIIDRRKGVDWRRGQESRSDERRVTRDRRRARVPGTFPKVDVSA